MEGKTIRRAGAGISALGLVALYTGVGGSILLLINIPSILMVFGLSTALMVFRWDKAAFHKENLPQYGLMIYWSGILSSWVGVIQVMANLDDPSSVGPAFAVCMLSFLYGVSGMLVAVLFSDQGASIKKQALPLVVSGVMVFLVPAFFMTVIYQWQ